MEEVISCGWLQTYDIVVCDNAAIHKSGYNSDLAEYLWDCPGFDGEPLRILLLLLSIRSPELNPIELLWISLAQRLRGLRRGVDVQHAVARAAESIMESFDFGLVKRTLHHCGYQQF